MTPKELRRLNRILVDKVHNRIPRGASCGQGVFQWKRSEEVLQLIRVGTETKETQTPAGLYVIVDEPKCEWQPQRPGSDWCLVKWTEPMPIEAWRKQFGETFGWPKDGYWFAIASLPAPLEPNERVTYQCADQILWQKAQGVEGFMRISQELKERREKQNVEEIGAMIEDSMTYHVPGARGGSYSAPFTKFDRQGETKCPN